MAYEAKQWLDGQTIRAADLNKLEQGVEEATTPATVDTAGVVTLAQLARPDAASTAVTRGQVDVNGWVGRVGTPCAVPTHTPASPAGEAVHPSVQYFPDGWNGHRYWMGYTPYGGGSDGHEDPCIAYSDDGITWETPAGAPFPLDDQPGSPRYNSDTNLVVKDGVLHLFWRYFDDTVPSLQETLFVSTSADGVAWTPKRAVYQSTKTDRRIVSPAFLWDGDRWHMWGVDIIPANKPLVHATSLELEPGQWTTPVACTVPMRSDKTPWHFCVRRVGSQYVGLMNDTLTGGAGARSGDLLLMASDDGITWQISDVPVIPRVGPHHDNLYKAELVPNETGFDVWYSARITGSPSVWGIFRTRLLPYDPAVPYSSEQGTVTLGTVNANGGSDEAAIAFTKGLFTRTPTVFVACNNGRISPVASGLSATGCTLKGFNWTTANAVNPILSWYAVQQSR